MRKYNNPRLLNTVVSGTGMKHPIKPHVIIGETDNGFLRGDLMDANAIGEFVDQRIEKDNAEHDDENVQALAQQIAGEIENRETAVSDLQQQINNINGNTEEFITATQAEQIASAAVSNVIGAAPEALNTLEELATALASEDSAIGSITQTLATKADKSQIGTLYDVYDFTSWNPDGSVQYSDGTVAMTGETSGNYSQVVLIISNTNNPEFSAGSTFYVASNAATDGETLVPLYNNKLESIGVSVKIDEPREATVEEAITLGGSFHVTTRQLTKTGSDTVHINTTCAWLGCTMQCEQHNVGYGGYNSTASNFDGPNIPFVQGDVVQLVFNGSATLEQYNGLYNVQSGYVGQTPIVFICGDQQPDNSTPAKTDTFKIGWLYMPNGETRLVSSISFDPSVTTASEFGNSIKDTTVTITTPGKDQFITEYLEDRLDTKVDKEIGKGLSTNDYTTNEKNLVAKIAQPDWNSTSSSSYATIKNKPTNVSAFTNDAGYLTQHQDISGKANSADLATVATSGSYEDLTDKPTIPTVPTTVSSFTNDSGYLTSTTVYSKTEIDNKLDDILGVDANGLQDIKSVLEDSDTTTGLINAIGAKANSSDLATVATSGSYVDLNNKPTLGTAAAKDVPSSGNASATQVVMGDDTRLTDSRNAADVYSWAKASSKPTYSYSEITNTPTLANVATSGSYNDLTDKPTISVVSISQSDYDTLVNNSQTDSNTLYIIQSSAS